MKKQKNKSLLGIFLAPFLGHKNPHPPVLKKRLLLATLSLTLTPLYCAAEQAVKSLNERYRNAGNEGDPFELVDGKIICKLASPPSFAIEDIRKELELPSTYMAGINPFKMYTREEYEEEAFAEWVKWNGYSKPVPGWINQRYSGKHCIECLKQLNGADIFEKYKKSKENYAWRKTLLEKTIPDFVVGLLKPKIIGFAALLVFIALGLPIALWNIFSGLSKVLFVRRPTILGDEDSDIYGSFFHRTFFRFPELPNVIVNDDLKEELDQLVKTNQLITAKNKGGWFSEPKKTPYTHILAYGPRGVGKTLVAKSLAKLSGMHFMYLTVSDLSQLPEEEALQSLKNFFRYARVNGPCLLIIDEADRLFAGEDVKSQKLATLFQKEFSKAVDENIQLFFNSNYPWLFPEPILNRMGKVIEFTVPNFGTQKELFVLHLSLALTRQKKSTKQVQNMVNYLEKALLEGLVGRDIESIAIAFSLCPATSQGELQKQIAAYKKSRENLKAFKAKALKTKPPSPERKRNQKTHKFW